MITPAAAVTLNVTRLRAARRRRRPVGHRLRPRRLRQRRHRLPRHGHASPAATPRPPSRRPTRSPPPTPARRPSVSPSRARAAKPSPSATPPTTGRPSSRTSRSSPAAFAGFCLQDLEQRQRRPGLQLHRHRRSTPSATRSPATPAASTSPARPTAAASCPPTTPSPMPTPANTSSAATFGSEGSVDPLTVNDAANTDASRPAPSINVKKPSGGGGWWWWRRRRGQEPLTPRRARSTSDDPDAPSTYQPTGPARNPRGPFVLKSCRDRHIREGEPPWEPQFSKGNPATARTEPRPPFLMPATVSPTTPHNT